MNCNNLRLCIVYEEQYFFHKWVVINDTVMGIIEDDHGFTDVIPIDDIRFVPIEETKQIDILPHSLTFNELKTYQKPVWIVNKSAFEDRLNGEGWWDIIHPMKEPEEIYLLRQSSRAYMGNWGNEWDAYTNAPIDSIDHIR